MIGGSDKILNFKDTSEIRRYITSYANSLWPSCVIIPEGNIWFIHKDAESVKAWDYAGGSDENQQTMFSVHFNPTELTIVTWANATIGEELERNLKSQIVFQGFVPI